MKTLISIIAVSFLSAAFVGTSSAADAQEKQQEILEKQQDVKEKEKELKQERRKESAERANESMQQVSRASKIIGTKVKNSNGDNLGNIKELVLDPESGQVVYAVVSFGGVLGVGNKLFAIPWKALHWTRDKEYYVLDVDKNTLKRAPGFDKKHWPDSSNKWDQQREELIQFYHVNP